MRVFLLLLLFVLFFNLKIGNKQEGQIFRIFILWRIYYFLSQQNILLQDSLRAYIVSTDEVVKNGK